MNRFGPVPRRAATVVAAAAVGLALALPTTSPSAASPRAAAAAGFVTAGSVTAAEATTVAPAKQAKTTKKSKTTKSKTKKTKTTRTKTTKTKTRRTSPTNSSGLQPPTSVSAAPGDRSATVRWTPPTGSVVRFRVTETGTGRSKTVGGREDGAPRSSLTFSGLPNRTPLTFVVAAEGPAGTSSPSRPSAPIVALPLMRVEDTIREGDRPVRTVLRVRLTEIAQAPIKVHVRTTAEGQATPGTDFVPLDTDVTVPAGKNSLLVPFTLVDDTTVEPDETVGIELTSLDARQDPATSVVIADDDEEERTWLYLDGAPWVKEGNSGVTPMEFGLRLSRPLSVPVTVLAVATTAGGDDLATLDDRQLSPAVQTVTIPPGSVLVPLIVGVRGDRLPEADARVKVIVNLLSGPVRVQQPINDGAVADDDTKTPTGADLAVRLPNAGGADALTQGRLNIELRNLSSVAAAGTSVVVTARTADALTLLDSSITPDPTCKRSLALDSSDAYPVTMIRWTCSVGALAARSTKTLGLALGRTTGSNVTSWSAAVVTEPFDDPDLSNNLARGQVGPSID
ncbi:MAG: Calx-beta domain-containing protein [Kineosporiaceae bacterium]